MTTPLNGKRIAFLVANSGVEQVELTSPWQHVLDAGGQPTLIAPTMDEVQAMNGDIEKGDTFASIASSGNRSPQSAMVLGRSSKPA